MSDDSNPTLGRRSVLAGAAGLTIAGAGVGAFSSSVAGANSSLEITGGSGSLANDRGDLTQVSIDPTLRVEWDNFDTAVGKVFVAVLAKTPDQDRYYPAFRTTPWLNSDGNGNPAKINGWRKANPAIEYSKPGTSGYLEWKKPLSTVAELSAAARDKEEFIARTKPVADNGIRLITEAGKPNYEDTLTDSEYEQYINGNSLGNTYSTVVEGVDDEYVKTYSGNPVLQNGYYGAVADTSAYDVSEDGTERTTPVDIRYLVGFYTVNEAVVWSEPSNGLSWGDEVTDDAVDTDWFSDVRPSDVQSTPNQNNSVLVMNGSDGYPDITEKGDFDAATNDYRALYDAEDHPAVLAENTQFEVTVTNEASSTGGSGDNNGDISGGGQ